MPTPLIVFLVAWFATVAIIWAVVLGVLRRSPGGDDVSGILWNAARVYAWIMHRPKYEGTELLPASDDDHNGLIVISNHTSALDPVLIQVRCHFLIRWLMASEMMGPGLEWLWRDKYVIPVDRNGKDSGPLREAIRHIKAGGAIGIFPEGRITMPPREIRPFLPGIGMIVAKTQAPVLLVWVSGTPETNEMGKALTTRSRSRIVFVDRIDFNGERDVRKITETLRTRLAEVSGWPLNDEILPPGGVVEDERRAA